MQTIAAKPQRLPSGAWGARVELPAVEAGAALRVRTRSGSEWVCAAGATVRSGSDWSLVATSRARPDRRATERTLEGGEAARSAAARRERESRAAVSAESFPVPEGLSYRPFQLAGIRSALDREDALIADEMGLGKTVQALGVVNADPTVRKVVVVCPATLRITPWQREAERWLVRPMSLGVVSGRKGAPPDTDIVVISYELLNSHVDALCERGFDLLVADEAHYAKNPKSQRSGALKQLSRSVRRKLFLTGTPILNRPVELHPLLDMLRPGEWPFWPFVRRYCGAQKDAHGCWDLKGSSHLDELQSKLRGSVMIRRLKREVLSELPRKERQVLALPRLKRVLSAERKALQRARKAATAALRKAELVRARGGDEALARAELGEARKLAFWELSRARRGMALAKAPAVAEHVAECAGNGKVVVFAHHRDVADAIREVLDERGVRHVSLDGTTPQAERAGIVDAFQADPAVRVFMGSIKAAGVGVTLTAASHVVFAELDWTPSWMTQAEDRCHRIGQRSSVLVQHVVMVDSIDATLAEKLIAKQAVMDSALGDETGEAGWAEKASMFDELYEELSREEAR